MSKAICVKKHFNSLNPGEIAVFEDGIAASIIERGLGEDVALDKAANAANATGTNGASSAPKPATKA